MSCLRYMCLFTYSGVQHILCCVCFVFLRIVYPMSTVALDCPFLIATSVFSNPYLTCLLNCFIGTAINLFVLF